jgi:hypothetical protein
VHLRLLLTAAERSAVAAAVVGVLLDLRQRADQLPIYVAALVMFMDIKVLIAADQVLFFLIPAAILMYVQVPCAIQADLLHSFGPIARLCVGVLLQAAAVFFLGNGWLHQGRDGAEHCYAAQNANAAV